MRKGLHNGLHQFAPQIWRKTHDLTGDYVFDSSIEKCKNSDMWGKLGAHLAGREAYGPKTAYSGYRGLAGDD